MKKAIALFLFALFFSGCAMNATRSLPFTEIPPPMIEVPGHLKKLRVRLDLDISGASVSGGHHEGLLQVRQPWVYGLSKEQKAALYNGLPEAVKYSIADELRRQGFNVVLEEGGYDVLITGKVESVELNTFGHGTKEGFGSAGDYWESEVRLKDLRALKKDKGFAEIGEITRYSKLPESPAELNWTIFTVVSRSLQASFKMAHAKDPVSTVYGTAKTFSADYIFTRGDITPAEVAARLSAIEMIERIKRLK